MAAGISLQTSFTFRLFPKPVEDMVNSPTGPISVRVKQAAEKLLEVANTKIGTRYSGHHSREKKLAESGMVLKAGAGPSWKVLWNHPIAKLHHDGSPPHSIGNPGQRLSNPRSPARQQGGPFFARGPVGHPGTHPNHYAEDAAQEIGLTLSGSILQGTQLVPLGRVPSGFA